jgi:hypothetical protein
VVGLGLIIPSPEPSVFAADRLGSVEEVVVFKDIVARTVMVAALLMPFLVGAAIEWLAPAAFVGPEPDDIIVSLRPAPEAVCMMADRLRCPVQTPITACPSHRVV